MSNIKDMNEILKKRIREERNRIGLTQKELSAKLGRGNGIISNYEKGDRLPPTDILYKLADIFGCSTDYLLGRTDNRNYSVAVIQNGNDTYEVEYIDDDGTKPTLEDIYKLLKEMKK